MHPHTSQTNYFLQFIKISSCTILLTVISTVWLPIIQYTYDYHPNELGVAGCMIIKYFFCTIYTTAWTFIMLICLVEVNNSSTNYLYDIIKDAKHNIIFIAILLAFVKAMCCLIPLIAFNLYESHNQFVANLGNICFIFECEAWSAVYLLFDFIYPGILPSVLFIFAFLFSHRQQTKSMSIQYEIELLDDGKINDISHQIETTSKHKIYPFLFMLTWSLSFFCSFLYGWVNMDISSKF